MTPLSGRVVDDPHQLIRTEVLDPQFRFEAEHLLPWYVAIEKALAAEYVRMGVIGPGDAKEIAAALDAITPREIEAWRQRSLSDIALAMERFVADRLPRPVPAWHVDRSRNDLQACAQLLAGKRWLCDFAAELESLTAAIRASAAASADLPMPGYTHYQAAQIITPGFYLAALAGRLQRRSVRMLALLDDIDACPLGAGAMSGQELAWDRDRLAALLGFSRAEPLALDAVASREWAAEVTAELSLVGALLSRLCTDLLVWGGSEHGFFELPDALSGISAAMPQKKNHPVLERVRGRSAHLAAFHVDVLLGQRNTPYTNLVEVSKESGAHLRAAFETGSSALRLLTAVFEGLKWRADRLRRACEAEFFGGFSLANRLTLTAGVPWRAAQVIAGAYVRRMVEAGAAPGDVDPAALAEIAARHGHPPADPDGLLDGVFDVDGALARLTSAGSARPDRVAEVLAVQEKEASRLGDAWRSRARTLAGVTAR
ncbi:argininosuccinate lyase [Herbidospora cretacea]|uniref:argininosuccinate lyase n=1 Tax=Herbidospora cretacea TaxID=28444 RepID=UPI0007736C30|nr:lyase family protein [Herbidospora cretacea]